MSVFKGAGENRKYTDYYDLYKKNTNEQSYELRNIEPEGTFRACDLIDYYEDEQELDGINMTKRRHLTIETPARITFHPGDLLISKKDNLEWAIRKVTIKDDNRAKDKSLRPIKVTVLELWG